MSASELSSAVHDTLQWVERQRQAPVRDRYILRQIELCALIARDAAAFHELYGGVDATATEVREQRGASGRVPCA